VHNIDKMKKCLLHICTAWRNGSVTMQVMSDVGLAARKQ